MPTAKKTIAELLEDDSFLQWVLHNTPESAAEWKEYLNRFPEESSVVRRARQELALIRQALLEAEMEHSFSALQHQIDRPLRRKKAWFAAAAAVVLLAMAAALFFTFQAGKPESRIALGTGLIADSTGSVELILENGDVILLDSARAGILSRQGNTDVMKLNDSELSYQPDKDHQALHTTINTIRTPPGRQYKLVLPDGSIVWLNAASSISFPAAFGDKERTVTVSGETYFEIAKDASRPFRVLLTSQGMVAEVLGTAFNLKAYAEEPEIQTTLIEGSLRLRNEGQYLQLLPNERGIMSSSGKLTKETVANLGDVTAWREGMFRFSSEDIRTIMREIARWYGLEVKVAPSVNNRFNLQLSRDMPLDELLEVLAMTGKVSFRKEGKILHVRK